MDLIFEDAFFLVDSGSFQLAERVNWKCEASSKNNATTYRVWWQKRNKGIAFYLLIGMNVNVLLMITIN